jgi:hypothetical protein
MGIAYETEGYNDPEHPDNATNDVPLTGAAIKGGPVGGSDSDEPLTEPTQEELDSAPDAPEDAITDDKKGSK